MRWLMEAPEIALPSVNAKTYRAMMALKGRQAWTDKVQKPDDSNIPAEEKLSLLRASHQDLSHMGGGTGIQTALKEEGKAWVNVGLDAQFLTLRCPECRANTTRGITKGEARHLPRTWGSWGSHRIRSHESDAAQWRPMYHAAGG